MSSLVRAVSGRTGRLLAVGGVVLLLSTTGISSAAAATKLNTNASWAATSLIKSRSSAIVAADARNGSLGSAFTRDLLAAYSDGKVVRFQSGSTIRACHLHDSFILGLYYLVVIKGYKLTVTSTNRWCDWTSGANHSYSYHWAYGGGGGLDIGAFTPPGKSVNQANAADYSDSTKRAQIDQLITDFMYAAGAGADQTKWQIGQRGCRPTGTARTKWDNLGYDLFDDECTHIHLSYKGNDRSYPSPNKSDDCYCSDFVYKP